ncbi:hypothetical protein OH76DRAFT_581948, partial [Lentinus brumalis]
YLVLFPGLVVLELEHTPSWILPPLPWITPPRCVLDSSSWRLKCSFQLHSPCNAGSGRLLARHSVQPKPKTRRARDYAKRTRGSVLLLASSPPVPLSKLFTSISSDSGELSAPSSDADWNLSSSDSLGSHAASWLWSRSRSAPRRPSESPSRPSLAASPLFATRARSRRIMRPGHAPKVHQRTSPANASRPSTRSPTKFCLPKCWMLVASAACGVGVSVVVLPAEATEEECALPLLLLSAFARGMIAGPGPTAGLHDG